MKRISFLAIVMAALMVISSASFVFADVNQETTIGIEIGDITSTSQAQADAAADARSKSLLISYDAKNWITAPLLSAFVNAPTSEVPQGWKALNCDPEYSEFTIAQLKSMAGGGSFFNKRGKGLKTLFSSRVITSVSFRSSRVLSDDTIIRVINNTNGLKGKNKSGSANGRGDYDSPVEQIFAETVLDVVEKTGSTAVAVAWDVIFERESQASTIGIGGSGSQADGFASSLSLGASSSDAATLTRTVYMISAKSYENVSEENFVCNECKQQTCTKEELQGLLDKIERNKKQIYGDGKKKGCDRYCLNNLKLRLERGKLYYEIFKCTGDHESLNEAI